MPVLNDRTIRTSIPSHPEEKSKWEPGGYPESGVASNNEQTRANYRIVLVFSRTYLPVQLHFGSTSSISSESLLKLSRTISGEIRRIMRPTSAAPLSSIRSWSRKNYTYSPVASQASRSTPWSKPSLRRFFELRMPWRSSKSRAHCSVESLESLPTTSTSPVISGAAEIESNTLGNVAAKCASALWTGIVTVRSGTHQLSCPHCRPRHWSSGAVINTRAPSNSPENRPLAPGQRVQVHRPLWRGSRHPAPTAWDGIGSLVRTLWSPATLTARTTPVTSDRGAPSPPPEHQFSDHRLGVGFSEQLWGLSNERHPCNRLRASRPGNVMRALSVSASCLAPQPTRRGVS